MDFSDALLPPAIEACSAVADQKGTSHLLSCLLFDSSFLLLISLLFSSHLFSPPFYFPTFLLFLAPLLSSSSLLHSRPSYRSYDSTSISLLLHYHSTLRSLFPFLTVPPFFFYLFHFSVHIVYSPRIYLSVCHHLEKHLIMQPFHSYHFFTAHTGAPLKAIGVLAWFCAKYATHCYAFYS